ncbi:hypothetical protein YC2023_037988 [Brassica napus]
MLKIAGEKTAEALQAKDEYEKKTWSSLGLGVFNSTRSTDLNLNRKNRNRIRTVLQKYLNGTYELTILDFGYNPNRTEIRIRSRRYLKLFLHDKSRHGIFAQFVRKLFLRRSRIDRLKD